MIGHAWTSVIRTRCRTRRGSVLTGTPGSLHTDQNPDAMAAFLFAAKISKLMSDTSEFFDHCTRFLLSENEWMNILTCELDTCKGLTRTRARSASISWDLGTPVVRRAASGVIVPRFGGDRHGLTGAGLLPQVEVASGRPGLNKLATHNGACASLACCSRFCSRLFSLLCWQPYSAFNSQHRLRTHSRLGASGSCGAASWSTLPKAREIRARETDEWVRAARAPEASSEEQST